MSDSILFQKYAPARRMIRVLGWLVLSGLIPVAMGSETLPVVPKWGCFDQAFHSGKSYPHPLQQATLAAVFTSPSGETNQAWGFWDGGKIWRVRFSPGQLGRWTYRTTCSDAANKGLANQSGAFLCTVAAATNRFNLHGPVRVTRDRLHFEHTDGTPFFWLGDAAWQGARSEPEAWKTYAGVRASQKFSAVQWIAVTAGGKKQPAFSGSKQIAINPDFFKRLDAKVDALNHAGLLSVIAPLWEIGASTADALPDDQAVLLLRYMAARWGANDIAWLLAFDGGGIPQNIGRWKQIGRAAFGENPHAPVVLFPGETPWVLNEFRDENWVDAFGFGIGHNLDEDSLKWLVSGPLAAEWKKSPTRPLLLISPPLEDSVVAEGKRISDDDVRRVAWWSLFLSPPAGVSYGADGIANWNTAFDRNKKGTPGQNLRVWQKSLFLPGAKEMGRVADFFNSIEPASLDPHPRMVAIQPGNESPRRYISAAITDTKDFAAVYVPEERTVTLQINALPPSPSALWTNPETGEQSPAVAVVIGRTCQFPTPAPGDWLLTIRAGK